MGSTAFDIAIDTIDPATVRVLPECLESPGSGNPRTRCSGVVSHPQGILRQSRIVIQDIIREGRAKVDNGVYMITQPFSDSFDPVDDQIIALGEAQMTPLVRNLAVDYRRQIAILESARIHGRRLKPILRSQ